MVNVYMFTGREYEQETGLYYYRARYYSPTLGRFLQRDLVKNDDLLNIYTYVGNNPISRMDPCGLCAIKCSFGFDLDKLSIKLGEKLGERLGEKLGVDDTKLFGETLGKVTGRILKDEGLTNNFSYLQLLEEISLSLSHQKKHELTIGVGAKTKSLFGVNLELDLVTNLSGSIKRGEVSGAGRAMLSISGIPVAGGLAVGKAGVTTNLDKTDIYIFHAGAYLTILGTYSVWAQWNSKSDGERLSMQASLSGNLLTGEGKSKGSVEWKLGKNLSIGGGVEMTEKSTELTGDIRLKF